MNVCDERSLQLHRFKLIWLFILCQHMCDLLQSDFLKTKDSSPCPRRFTNDMHWTNPVGVIRLFVCVYAKGHRLLNNLWEKGGDNSPPSFFASGWWGEGVCEPKTLVAANSTTFLQMTLSLPLEMRTQSLAPTKKMHWLTFTHTYFPRHRFPLGHRGGRTEAWVFRPVGWGKDMPSVWAWAWIHEASHTPPWSVF